MIFQYLTENQLNQYAFKEIIDQKTIENLQAFHQTAVNCLCCENINTSSSNKVLNFDGDILEISYR